MSQIRRQSIISTVFVYVGFLIGFVNTYFFTKEGIFKVEEYGLTMNVFMNVGNLIFAFANLGTISVIYKFFPYYKDNLHNKKNDLLTWALLISICGFILVSLAGYFLRDLVVRKFSANSPDFIKYYFWVFPFGFSILIFSLLEVHAWNLKKSVLTTFLREVLFRILIMALIFLYIFGIVKSYDVFIKLFAFTYALAALVLLIYLIWKKELYLPLGISRVTKKFRKKLMALAGLAYFGGLVAMVASSIELIAILSLVGTAAAGVFGLATVVSGLVQAPQRGAIAASIPVLSKAWKDKDYTKINLIYQRSGINLLIASLGIFLVVWLNYDDAIRTFHLRTAYFDSKWVFFFIGLAKIVDLGTGVNSQIIGTSTYWRFEFFSGMILVCLAVPTTYFFVKEFGIVGAAYSYLLSFSVYNLIRIIFLIRKYQMHPFSVKTLYAIILAVICYALCYYSFINFHGLLGIFLKSAVFISLYAGTVIYFDLSPDVLPVWKTIQRKTRIKKRGPERPLQ